MTMTKAKAWVAAVAAVLIAVQTALPLTEVQHNWVAAGIAILGAVSVYLVPNHPVDGDPVAYLRGKQPR